MLHIGLLLREHQTLALIDLTNHLLLKFCDKYFNHSKMQSRKQSINFTPTKAHDSWVSKSVPSSEGSMTAYSLGSAPSANCQLPGGCPQRSFATGGCHCIFAKNDTNSWRFKLAPVEVASLSHSLKSLIQLFKHPRWCRSSTMNRIVFSMSQCQGSFRGSVDGSNASKPALGSGCK